MVYDRGTFKLTRSDIENLGFNEVSGKDADRLVRSNIFNDASLMCVTIIITLIFAVYGINNESLLCFVFGCATGLVSLWLLFSCIRSWRDYHSGKYLHTYLDVTDVDGDQLSGITHMMVKHDDYQTELYLPYNVSDLNGRMGAPLYKPGDPFEYVVRKDHMQNVFTI